MLRESEGRYKLIWSPDTDVFHIGLPLLDSTMQVIVQLSLYSSIEHRYMHLGRLHTALNNDPDLSTTPPEFRPKLLQSLFICTGCDYTSFFVGFGKAIFMRYAFQHNNFINADTEDFPGSLIHTVEQNEKGFLAFLRLVGTAYYKKHLACFQFESPSAFFNSIPYSDRRTKHKMWLTTIRDVIWEHAEFEDELPPSIEALERHWLRTCWVSQCWNQAMRNRCNTLDITTSGWKVVDGHIEIDWDDQENVMKVRNNVQLLLHGCSCKTGCCTQRCSCVKGARKCGPGCSCSNCHNSACVTASIASELENDELQEAKTQRQAYFNELVDDGDSDELEEIEQISEDFTSEDQLVNDSAFENFDEYSQLLTET